MIHLQSTICSVQQVTEAAKAVVGQEAWAHNLKTSAGALIP